MNLNTVGNCPLCEHGLIEHYYKDKKRDYFNCQQCNLVFVDPRFLPTVIAEKAEYDLHQNTIDDKGYLNFLSRTTRPLIELLNSKHKESSQGLDFGCGPTPALSHLMKNAGFKMNHFDPIYYANQQVLEQKYDFITCTEAVEHFHYPGDTFTQLVNLLKDGGVLAIMTKLVLNKEKFASWHYKNDPTHVSFFSRETFNFIAQQYQLSVAFVDNDVIFLSSRR